MRVAAKALKMKGLAPNGESGVWTKLTFFGPREAGRAGHVHPRPLRNSPLLWQTPKTMVIGLFTELLTPVSWSPGDSMKT